MKDGALAQSSNATDCRAVAGDVNWTDYTYRVKARKISGDEGFLVLFHVENRNNYIWWNIGGWGNTRSALERATNGAKRELGQVAPVTVEPGRWYDIRVEVQGPRIRCYLDDKLITEAIDNPSPPVEPLYATASRDRATGDVIVKVVNVSASAQELQIALKGLASLAGGTIYQLRGDPEAVNSIAEPIHVAPRTMPLAVRSPTFVQAFPAHSVSVLRLKTR